VVTAVLTPHHFHEHDEHKKYFSHHFIGKGVELANACDQAIQLTENAKKAL
jgi:6,7-dimethyl-8-ribityllumazine synthase